MSLCQYLALEICLAVVPIGFALRVKGDLLDAYYAYSVEYRYLTLPHLMNSFHEAE